jgi:hypothetical protein
MNFFLPTTPATTGPVPMPMRTSRCDSFTVKSLRRMSRIASAMSAMAAE